MSRHLVSSGSPYEEHIGFSRAVRVGNVIAISGTAPIGPDGATVGVDDAYRQTRRCLEIIKKAIEDAGGRLDDVIRTRIYLTNAEIWRDVARAHGEYFGNIKPAATAVVVNALLQPEWLVEIEADCLIEDR